jgi:hypothetical protein
MTSFYGLGAGGSSDQPKAFYDKMVYDTLSYKKKQGAKHEVGVEIEGIIPDAAEIRLLGNRHRQCKYYQIGVDVCHTSMLM